MSRTGSYIGGHQLVKVSTSSKTALRDRREAEQKRRELRMSEYRKAAGDGGADAQYIYAEGQDVAQDYVQAVSWYRKAAKQGHAIAQNMLGFMYSKGQGVTRNYRQAVSWYRKAAKQGHPSTQYNLGIMYAKGQGVTRNYRQAVSWYRKAAEQGHAKALSKLGLMYVNGEGVPKDYVHAHKWFSLAASRFDASKNLNRENAVRNRDIVAAKMTPAQIAEAQKLAREWKPKPER